MKKKIAAVFSAAAIIVLIREFYCIIAYLFNISVLRGDKKFLSSFVDLRKEAKAMTDDLNHKQKDMEKWLQTSKSRHYYIKSFDNISLYGKTILKSNPTNKWAVIVHGYGVDGVSVYYAGKKFYEHNFNVLIPDCRGHGKSGGKYIGFGYKDSIDIIYWCRLILKMNSNAKIVLYGVSMGGNTVMTASGNKKLPSNVTCIVEDCGYTSAYDIIKYHIKRLYNLPAFPVLFFVNIMCIIKSRYSLKGHSAVTAVKNSHVPIMFIHGRKDKFVPYKMNIILYNSAACPKKRLIIENAGHGVSAFIDEKKYWNEIFLFIDKYMNSFP